MSPVSGPMTTFPFRVLQLDRAVASAAELTVRVALVQVEDCAVKASRQFGITDKTNSGSRRLTGHCCRSHKGRKKDLGDHLDEATAG